jgi:hypothetical protein
MQSLPYQSINISGQPTLAGHSMTSNVSNARVPMSSTPDPGSIPPMTYPQGSLPPQSQLATQPVATASGRRILVIVVAAVVVSTIGILIVMLT